MRLWVAILVGALALGGSSVAGATGSGGCAVMAPSVRAPVAGVGTLVSPGARSALVCRYRGLNPAATARRLSVHRLVTSRIAIAGLTRELDALPGETAAFHCPMDDGGEIAVTFRYARGGVELVTIGLTGCATVTNGRVTRTAATGTGPKLIERLEELVS